MILTFHVRPLGRGHGLCDIDGLESKKSGSPRTAKLNRL